MNQLEYIPGRGGENAIPMDGLSAYVGTAEKLRSRSWNYDLGYRGLLNANRPAREVAIDFWTDYETADALRRVADADVYARTPGTFLAQGEWKQRAYIVESDPKDIHFGWLSTSLKALLLDGAWWRLVTRSFQPSGSPGTVPLDYPYDYPYDLGADNGPGEVEPSVLTPSDVRIVIYGAAINPYVIVGGNTYQVNVTVPSGGYLIIDGRDKTIELTLADGTVQNAFQYGVRGSGQGGGTYIFEPLPSGAHEVTWDGSFSFDFGWYEEEGEPPWSQS